MAQLQMKSGFTRKLKLPLILTLAHLEDQFEGIDVGLFPSSASKSVTVNSFNARRALERIGQSDPGKMYQVMALSSIKQTAIPMHRLHADTTTISFYGNIARKSRRLPGMLF